MIRKRIVMMVVLMLSVMTMMGQQVSVADAMARAKVFLKKPGGAHHVIRKEGKVAGGDVELQLAYTEKRDADEKVCFYVFNYSDQSGFIIMGGDESARQVLAYSDNGSFDYDKAPDNFKWWLSQYKSDISYAMDNSAVMTPRKVSATIASRSDVSPLITTTWDQDSPYSDAVNAAYKAQGGSKTFVTGCVATAMAQVMKYWECPTTGTGSHSYTCKTNTDFKPSVDFSATTYDWNNMINDYSDTYTPDQGNAVATLMYHAGVSINMDYNTSDAGGSGAYTSDVPNALKKYFGYDKSIRDEYRKYMSDESWEAMIYKELVNNRPVIYAGSDASKNTGHCFVCDGYKASDNTYHFNWGWGGYCDCYCPMTGTDAIKPGGSGIGGTGVDDEYNTSQEALINIMSDRQGLETPVVRNYTNTIALNDGTQDVTSYSHNHGTSKTLKLTENVFNASVSLSSFTLGVKATDTTTGTEFFWADATASVPARLVSGNCSASFDVNDIPYNGTYKVQLVARNSSSTSDNDWYDVECTSSVTFPTVIITGATDPIQPNVNFAISNTEVETSRTIYISHTSNYNGDIDYSSSDENIASVSSDGVITGVTAGKVTITAHASGNLYFKETTKVFNVTVRTFQRDDVDVTISSTGLQVGQTATISITSGYDGTPSYSSSNNDVATVANGEVTAIAAGDATITVTIPETDNYNGKTVTFDINVTASEVFLTEAPYFTNDNNVWAGDANLHYCIKKTSTTQKTVYFLMKFYKVTESEDTYMGGLGFSLTSADPFTYASTYNVYSSKFEEGAKYRIEFYSDTLCTVPYNIPSITLTYRPTANIDLSIGAAKYATLILPFNADIPTKDKDGNILDWKAYECKELAGNTLELKEVTSIKRNTPYLFSGSVTGTYTFTGPLAVDASPILFSNGLLSGTMLENGYEFKAGDYILQNQNGSVAFYKYIEGTSNTESDKWYATPYRAFIQTSAKSTYSRFSFPTINGISPIEMSKDEGQRTKAGIYSVDGTRHDALQPGLNIVVDENGVTRKFFVKH